MVPFDNIPCKNLGNKFYEMVRDSTYAHAYKLEKELQFLKRIREALDFGPSTSGGAGLEQL